MGQAQKEENKMQVKQMEQKEKIGTERTCLQIRCIATLGGHTKSKLIS
jgi:hypothetical protein